MAALCGGGVGSAAQSQPQPIAPFDLGHDLEIRDYRIFPSEDVRRFIVEVHNTSDEPIDTPSVGVVLPHLDSETDFGWAHPVTSVLYPGTSDMLIGVAPAALTSDDDWGVPEWVLCREISTRNAEMIDGWDFLLQTDLAVEAPDFARAYVTLVNTTAHYTGPLRLVPTVRDGSGRMCGTLSPIWVPWTRPGEPVQKSTEMGVALPDIANPFYLINTLQGVEVAFSIQPDTAYSIPSCRPILPWSSP